MRRITPTDWQTQVRIFESYGALGRGRQRIYWESRAGRSSTFTSIPEGWMSCSAKADRARALPCCIDLRAEVILGEAAEPLKEMVEAAWAWRLGGQEQRKGGRRY